MMVHTEENLIMTKAILAWKGYNKKVVNEANNIKNNINKAVDMKFPSNMPVLFFTTQEDQVTEDGKNNVTLYETQITNYSASKIVTLQEHHDLHWIRYKEICKEVNELIESLDII